MYIEIMTNAMASSMTDTSVNTIPTRPLIPLTDNLSVRIWSVNNKVRGAVYENIKYLVHPATKLYEPKNR